MKDEKEREFARLGDTTDHGGKVIQAAVDLTDLDIPVALDKHLVICPQCKGLFPIIATGKRAHNGKRVAYLGDKTGCGATLIRG